MAKILLFPIETFARELDYRILLAARLTSEGFRIVLGKHSALMASLPAFEGACYVGKQVIRPHAPRDCGDLGRLHRHNIRFVHYDTEGAVYPGHESDWKRILDTRLDPTVLKGSDGIFTWGEYQRAYYSQRSAAPTFTVGNPHFDLLQPQYRKYFQAECQRIRSQYGDFILINTSFARANHGHGLREVFSPNNGYNPNEAGSVDRVIQRWLDQTRQIANFVELIHVLTSKTKMKIVIRPHPSESLELYQTLFTGRDHVSVVREGAAGPWIICADKVIHHGCTTAVEAWFAGTPAIHFEDSREGGEVILLPRSVSHVASTIDECIELVRTGDLQRPDEGEYNSQLLFNFKGDSLETFVESLLALEIDPSSVDVHRLTKLLTAYELGEKLRWPLRQVNRRHKTANAYARSKFPGFSKQLVEGRVNAANTCVGSHARYRILGAELMEIYAE